jgi:nucleoid DNA-binding protein
MNKIQLIERIALEADISKATSSRLVKSIIRTIIAKEKLHRICGTTSEGKTRPYG